MNANLQAQMQPISNATVAGAFLFLNPKAPLVAALLKQNLIESNTTVVDSTDANRVAIRATPAGLAACPATVAPQEAFPPVPAPSQPAAASAPVTDPATGLTDPGNVPVTQVPAKGRGSRGPRGKMPVPVITRSAGPMPLPTFEVGKRGGKRGETYPFSTLLPPDGAGNGDSFFVAMTADVPNPVKTLKAAIQSANKRYLNKGGAKFNVLPDSLNGVAGARVWRIA